MMKIYQLFFINILLFLYFGCNGKTKVKLPNSANSSQTQVKISTIQVNQNQFILGGAGLSQVNSLRLTGSGGFNQELTIESKSSSSLIANGKQNLSFVVGQIFNLIVSSAYGAASYQVSFTLNNGAVTASMLHHMGASAGQVLKYNGSAWAPGDLSALTYAGGWNATTNSPNILGGGSAGEFYIVTTAGSFDLAGGPGTNSWSVGDWALWNSGANRWDKVPTTGNIVSFNGRGGAVTPQSGDYTWAQITKTTSALTDIADVDTTGIATGKILKWDGSQWAIADDNAAGAATSVSASTGTVGAPSMSFSGDTDTGFYSSAANTIGVSTGGAQIFSFSSGGLSSSTSGGGLMTSALGSVSAPTFSFAGDSDTGLYTPAGNTLAFSSGGSEKARINSTGMEVSGALTVNEMSAPAVSGSNQGRIYFDAALNKFRVSEHGGAYVDLIGSGGASQWTTSSSDINFTTGNVGIGVASPSSRLDVRNVTNSSETARFTNTAGDGGGTVGVGYIAINPRSPTNFSATRIGAIEASAATFRSHLVFETRGVSSDSAPTERMRIDADGKVGIGTYSPTGTLHVDGGVAASGAGVPITIKAQDGSTTGDNAGGAIDIKGGKGRDYGAGGTVTISGGDEQSSGASASGSTLKLFGGIYGGPGGGAELAGGVGENGLGDGGKLTIASNSGNGVGGIIALATSSGDNGGDIAITGGAARNCCSIPVANGGSVLIDGGEKLSTGNDGNIILGSVRGNIGIGTTSPQTKLHLQQSGSADIRVTSTGGTASVSLHSVAAGDRWTLLSNGNFRVYDSSMTTFPMTIERSVGYANEDSIVVKGTGNVGIGTSTVNYKLDVAGDVNASGCVRAGGSTLGGTCASDERLKKNVISFDLGLSVLLGLEPRYFEYNGLGGLPSSSKPEIGFIAQEVEAIAPQLIEKKQVKLHPKDTHLTSISQVNYSSVLYILVNALKEFYQEWWGEKEELKREIANLKSENQQMKSYLCQKDPGADFCSVRTSASLE
jgi:hypothetical protein